MFENKSYMTRGFQEDIPDWTKVMIFHALNTAKMKWQTLDYLQVFTLKHVPADDGHVVQCLIHTQECPEEEAVYYFDCNCDDLRDITIFGIDDETHHTFLLAS